MEEAKQGEGECTVQCGTNALPFFAAERKAHGLAGTTITEERANHEPI